MNLVYPIQAILIYLSILFAPPDVDRITIDMPGKEPRIELVRNGGKWESAGNVFAAEKDSLVTFGPNGRETLKISDFIALPGERDWSKNPKLTLGGGTTMEKVATGFTIRRNPAGGEGNGVYQIQHHKPGTFKVLGEVVNQGVHPLPASGQLHDAITAAGGPTTAAEMKRVSIIRGPAGSVPDVTTVDLTKTEASGPRIQAGDTIHVPKSDDGDPNSTGGREIAVSSGENPRNRANSPPPIMPGEGEARDKGMVELEKAILEQEMKVKESKQRLEAIIKREVNPDDALAMGLRNQEHVDEKRNMETQEALLGAMNEKWKKIGGAASRKPTAADPIDEIPFRKLPASNRLQIRVVAPDDPQAVDAVQIREDGTRTTLKISNNVVVCDQHVKDAGIQKSSDGYGIMVTLNEVGEKRLAAATKGADGKMRLAVIVDGEVKSAPVVMSQLGRQFVVEGFRDHEKCHGIVRGLVEWPDDQDLSAMREWMEKIDQGKAGQAWTMASEYFRQNVTREKWDEMASAARQPLGGLVTRRLLSAKRVDSPPGAPDGLYLVSEFESSFENKKHAKEVVTLKKDKEDRWRVCGYFIL